MIEVTFGSLLKVMKVSPLSLSVEKLHNTLRFEVLAVTYSTLTLLAAFEMAQISYLLQYISVQLFNHTTVCFSTFEHLQYCIIVACATN